MKESLLNLGKVLNKNQQRKVVGGDIITATICDDRHCWQGQVDTLRQIQRADGTYVA